MGILSPPLQCTRQRESPAGLFARLITVHCRVHSNQAHSRIASLRVHAWLFAVKATMPRPARTRKRADEAEA